MAQRLAHLALPPVAARLADQRHDFATAIAATGEAALRSLQFGQCVRRGRVPEPPVPQRQAGPAFRRRIAASLGGDERLLRERE